MPPVVMSGIALSENIGLVLLGLAPLVTSLGVSVLSRLPCPLQWGLVRIFCLATFYHLKASCRSIRLLFVHVWNIAATYGLLLPPVVLDYSIGFNSGLLISLDQICHLTLPSPGVLKSICPGMPPSLFP